MGFIALITLLCLLPFSPISCPYSLSTFLHPCSSDAAGAQAAGCAGFLKFMFIVGIAQSPRAILLQERWPPACGVS